MTTLKIINTIYEVKATTYVGETSEVKNVKFFNGGYKCIIDALKYYNRLYAEKIFVDYYDLIENFEHSDFFSTEQALNLFLNGEIFINYFSYFDNRGNFHTIDIKKARR